MSDEIEVLAFCEKCKAITPHTLTIIYIEHDMASSGIEIEEYEVLMCKNCKYKRGSVKRRYVV